MTFDRAQRICRVAERLLTAPGRFTPQVVAAICGVELSPVDCMNSLMHEYVGRLTHGPFATITFRGPAAPDGPAHCLVVLDPAAGEQIDAAALREVLDLCIDGIEMSPEIPYDGAVTHHRQLGPRTLYLQFNARSQVLQTLAVHEDS